MSAVKLTPAQLRVLILAGRGVVRRWAGTDTDGASRWFEDAHQSSIGLAALHRAMLTLLRRELVDAVGDGETHERAVLTAAGRALLDTLNAERPQ